MCSLSFLSSRFITYTPSFILGKLFFEKMPLNLGSTLLKGWSRSKKFYLYYPIPAPPTPLPLIPFTTKEITGCTNEVAKGASKVPRNLPSCSFISCFTVSVTPSINTPNLLMIL